MSDWYGECESVMAMLLALLEGKKILLYTPGKELPIYWELGVSLFSDTGFLCYRYPGNGTTKYMKVTKNNLRSLCEQSVKLKPVWDAEIARREQNRNTHRERAIAQVKTVLEAA